MCMWSSDAVQFIANHFYFSKSLDLAALFAMDKSVIIFKSMCNPQLIAYGMIRAPRRAIASPVAPAPLSLGMKSPLRTSTAGGFTKLISPKKHAAMTNTSIEIRNSSFRT